MSRFYNYLNERKSNYLYGITFVDIDSTLFHTFAKILVKDKETDKTIRELDNQEFNSYQLKDNEYFDFGQFRNAKFFKETSIPIKPTVNRIKKMINNIKSNDSKSKVIFLTARSDFDDKETLLSTFKEYGIDVDFKSNVYIERTGNMKTGTVESRKEKVIMNYLKEGIYRRVRLLDDHIGNVKMFSELADKVPENIINKVRENANIPEDSNEPIMTFYSLLVEPSGKLKLYSKNEVK